MQVGKRIYLKREMPDLKVVKSFAKLLTTLRSGISRFK